MEWDLGRMEALVEGCIAARQVAAPAYLATSAAQVGVQLPVDDDDDDDDDGDLDLDSMDSRFLTLDSSDSRLL